MPAREELYQAADQKSRFVQVAIPGPLRQLFDYMPENGKYAHDYPVGSRVEVPFGRGKKVGFVIAHTDICSVPEEKLKAIASQPENCVSCDTQGSPDAFGPLISTRIIQLAHWLADYYHHPIGDCLATLLPNLLTRTGSASLGYTRRVWSISTHGLGLNDDSLSRAPKQQALLNALRAAAEQSKASQNIAGEISLSDAELQERGHKLGTARELARKGLIEAMDQTYIPDNCDAIIQGSSQQPPHELNTEQALALKAIDQLSDSFAPCLLEGITGSGKTEVYLQVIAKVLADGKQVLVLVPEIGLTPQTIARFANRFACQIAVIHSGLNDRERLAAWQSAKIGQARVIIGTRSAVFTPMHAPGLIVVDEEHDSSYKQQEGLRYHARDVAVKRAQLESIPVVLGSATPSLETLLNTRRDKYRHCTLTQRAANASPASIEFVDIRHLALHDGLADQSIQAIADTLKAKGQVLVFINRRGFSPLLMCSDCGWAAECSHCDARLTLHLKARQLRCHHCDHIESIPVRCPRCQSSQIQYVGQGTERTTEALAKLFPATDVIRIDRDTSRQKQALTNHINTIKSNKPLIIVGTQMLAKGHDFAKLDTVIVLNVDDTLYHTDYKSSESTLQLLTQVSGRAGRSTHKGRVLIQTLLPDHPLLTQWAEQGYQGVSEQLLSEREDRMLPPFSYLTLLRADSSKAQQALAFLQQIASQLQQAPSLQSQLVGPLPAIMEKRAGRHRAQLLMKAATRKQLHQDIRLLLATLEGQKLSSGLRWSIDVDPQETV